MRYNFNLPLDIELPLRKKRGFFCLNLTRGAFLILKLHTNQKQKTKHSRIKYCQNNAILILLDMDQL